MERESQTAMETEGSFQAFEGTLEREPGSWTSKRSSVNDLKQAQLVRALTPLVENKAQSAPAASSSSVSSALSLSAANMSKLKVPDLIASDNEGSQGTEDSFQAFEGTLV